jgi:nucleoside-diphosphate kinase
MDQSLGSRYSHDPQYTESEVGTQTTFMLIKPDGVQRGLLGPIIQRIEKMGLKPAGFKLMNADVDTISKHYSKHKN